KSFIPNQVQYHGGALRFLFAEMEVEVPLGLPLASPVEGRRITAAAGKAGRPPVLLAWTEPGRPARDLVYVADDTLKVEFDRVAGVAGCSLLPGAMASSETFAPRSTRLDVSGTDRADFVCRRLPPGRYFFCAGWKERGLAWRWVDVRDGGQLTVDFTIDPGRT